MSNLSYTIWSIWGVLPILHKLFFLILVLVSIYTLYAASITLVRLRSITNQRSLAALQARSANTRQLVNATFYLFGFVFFLTLPGATFVSELSRTPTAMLILRNFLMHFAFAANVFFVFLVLHSLQWFVSARVYAYVLRLTSQGIPKIGDSDPSLDC